MYNYKRLFLGELKMQQLVSQCLALETGYVHSDVTHVCTPTAGDSSMYTVTSLTFVPPLRETRQ